MFLPVLSKPVSRKRFMKLSNTALVNPSDNGDDDDDAGDDDDGGDDGDDGGDGGDDGE